MSATVHPDASGPLYDGDDSAASSPRAGFWRRFTGSMIDGVAVIFAAYAFSYIAIEAYYVVAIVGGCVYYALLEGGENGQTLGKMAVGVRVVSLADGGPIGHARAFGRWIGRIVSGAALLLGYLWMLWDADKQTWHDKMADSVVVRVDAVATASV